MQVMHAGHSLAWHDKLTLDRHRTTGSPSGVSSVGSENRSHFVAIPVSSSLSAERLAKGCFVHDSVAALRSRVTIVVLYPPVMSFLASCLVLTTLKLRHSSGLSA